MMMGGKSLNVFASNVEDPYITVPDEADLSDQDDEADIRKSDYVFCVGTCERETHRKRERRQTERDRKRQRCGR